MPHIRQQCLCRAKLPAMATLRTLRDIYHAHLASPLGDAPGRSVAGKETRRGMRRGAQWAAQSQAGWDALAAAWQDAPERVLAWSDHHLQHDNIIQYTDRPFGGARHMDGEMLSRAHAIVEPDQWLLFVGDLAMWRDAQAVSEWMAACPGRKALILGNHDLRGRECPASIEAWQALGFEAVADCVELPAAQDLPSLWITHYPLRRETIPAGVLNVHGHTHRQQFEGPFVNMCVEHLDYRPVSLLDRVRAASG